MKKKAFEDLAKSVRQAGRIRRGAARPSRPPKTRQHHGATMKIKQVTTHGNVFRHLGFSEEEAENLKIRSHLMNALIALIESRGLTRLKAAKLFGVSQPRVSDLTRGKIDKFSVDTLIAMLGSAGVGVSVEVRNRGGRLKRSA